jgi:hypothetical protein
MPSRLIGLIQITLVMIAIYLNPRFKKLYTPDNLLQIESRKARDKDLALLDSVSADASAMTILVIHPLQNQASLWVSNDIVSVVNARSASSAAASVTTFQIFNKEFLGRRKSYEYQRYLYEVVIRLMIMHQRTLL